MKKKDAEVCHLSVCMALNGAKCISARTLDDARSPSLWYLGLEHEILVLKACAQSLL